MKRFLSLALAVALGLSLVACSSNKTNEDVYEVVSEETNEICDPADEDCEETTLVDGEVPTWPCGTPMTPEEIEKYYK